MGWGGFELLQGVEGAIKGAAGGIDAPLELAEGLVLIHARLAEGKIVFHGEGFLMGIFKELGFGDAEAAGRPLRRWGCRRRSRGRWGWAA